MGDGRRVVVTGMGAVTPLGMSVAESWGAMCRGESGIRPISRFDTAGWTYRVAGEIRADIGDGSGPDRATALMLRAAREAFQDSFGGDGSPPVDAGVVVSTNFGGSAAVEHLIGHVLGKEEARAEHFSDYGFQACADRVAAEWGLSGPRAVLSLSCSSGSAALGYGADLVRAGRADVVLTGGYDALSRFAWSGLSALRTMTKDQLRPFDLARSGTIFSEGAGALVVEALEHAEARGAKLHAELLGYGTNNNAFHMTAPAKEGAGTAAVMQMALDDAAVQPDEIDHINAHGTGTKYNDATETAAIKTVFGVHARRISVTSIKSMTGHMMGAAGSVEAIASVRALQTGRVPPTINFREPDPECDLDYAFNETREQDVRTVLSNSAGIGGCNAAVVLRRPECSRGGQAGD